MIRRVASVWGIVAILAISACAQFNPIAQANTVEQKALAAYGSLVIGVEQIAELVRPRTLPSDVQARLIALGEKSGALAKSGLAAYNEAQSARAAFVTNAGSEGRLTAAVNSLDRWVTDAEPVVTDLKSAIRGAQ